MKIACSSASFGAALDAGELTQLEWLDLCANELEVDGVVFDARHFPRTDDEYLAQLLKTATDLGLGIAGLSADSLFDEGAPSWLETAKTLRAPLVLARAPAPADDATAWTRFSARAKAKAGEGKALNVTLALRNAPATLCANAADLRALAKDVDSAWLRFALDLAALESSEAADALLSKTAIAVHDMRDLASFARDGDSAARTLVQRLRRFRGYVLLECGDGADDKRAYHAAVERFEIARARALFALAADK